MIIDLEKISKLWEIAEGYEPSGIGELKLSIWVGLNTDKNCVHVVELIDDGITVRRWWKYDRYVQCYFEDTDKHWVHWEDMSVAVGEAVRYNIYTLYDHDSRLVFT